MILTFLGTRGNIEAKSRRHRRHTATLVETDRGRVLIDCGADWASRAPRFEPDAIVLTHSHVDHAGGLTSGITCPVYATAWTWERVGQPGLDRRTITPRRRTRIAGLTFQAVPVEHSVNHPAVGYRVQHGRTTIFYVPDVADMPDAGAALARVRLYVGDGACVTRPLLRRQAGALVGHTTIAAQLAWCGRHGVRRAVFTHCGSVIVEGDERKLSAQVRALGREHGVEARIARDGMSIDLG